MIMLMCLLYCVCIMLGIVIESTIEIEEGTDRVKGHDCGSRKERSCSKERYVAQTTENNNNNSLFL